MIGYREQTKAGYSPASTNWLIGYNRKEAYLVFVILTGPCRLKGHHSLIRRMKPHECEEDFIPLSTIMPYQGKKGKYVTLGGSKMSKWKEILANGLKLFLERYSGASIHSECEHESQRKINKLRSN